MAGGTALSATSGTAGRTSNQFQLCFLDFTSGRGRANCKPRNQQHFGLFRCSLVISSSQHQQHTTNETGITAATRIDSQTLTLPTRRQAIMLQVAAFAALIPSPPAHAVSTTDVPADFRLYSDDVNKYKIVIPQDWQVGAGETDGIKSITAFYPQGTSASNVSVVITGLGPDFTRLESFGKVDAFAESLVNGLDRSWQRPPGVAAKLIDCKAANGLYYIEYTLQNPGETQRHIYSAIGMANNGWYNRLYTVTGQFVEDEADKYRSKIEKAVQSFRLSS